MNTLLKWKKGNPLAEHSQHPFLNLQNEVDKAFRDFYDMFGPSKSWEQFENLNLMPSMDVVEDKDHFTIQMEMPGMDEKDISVSFSGNILTITGEKSTSKKMIIKNTFLEKSIMVNMNARSLYLPLLISTRQRQVLQKECFGLSCLKNPKQKGSFVI